MAPPCRRSYAPVDEEIRWMKETLQTRETEPDARKSLPTEFSKILTESLLDPPLFPNSDSTIDRLTQQVKDLETYKTLYFQEMQELQKLRTAVSQLQFTLEHSVGSIGKLETDLAQRRSKEDALRLENQEIRLRMQLIESRNPFNDVAETEREKLEKVLKTHTFQRLGNTTSRIMSDAMHCWLLRAVEIANDENAFAAPSLHLSSISELDYSLIEKDDLTRNNPLVQMIKKQGESWNGIMPKTRVLRLFEDTINAKYETDLQDLAANRPFRPLCDFMSDYIIRKFGLPKLAIHEVCQFIPGLFKLYQENHPFGVVISRLLCLFHPEPITNSIISSFLIKIKVEFANQTEIVKKTGKITNGTPKSGAKSMEYVESGGFVQLSEVLSTVYKVFEGCKELGMFAVALLKPEILTHEEYISFLLCHKIATTGRRPDDFYRLMDSKSSNTVPVSALIASLYEELELWVQMEDLNVIFKTNSVSLKEYLKAVNYERYFSYALSTDLQVSGQTFVRVLVDVYDYMLTLHTESISDVFFNLAKADEMTAAEFQKSLSQLDPCISSFQIKQITSNVDTRLDLYAFQRVVLENNIGGMGIGPFKVKNGEKMLSEKTNLLSPEAKYRKNVDFEPPTRLRMSGKQLKKPRKAII